MFAAVVFLTPVEKLHYAMLVILVWLENYWPARKIWMCLQDEEDLDHLADSVVSVIRLFWNCWLFSSEVERFAKSFLTETYRIPKRAWIAH